MSVNINGSYTFYGSADIDLLVQQLQAQLDNIGIVINNANAGLTTWDNIKVTTLVATTATITNGTITTPTFTNPVTIASGGTNSGTALNNNRIIVSSSGKIVEASAITASRVICSDSNGLPTGSPAGSVTLNNAVAVNGNVSFSNTSTQGIVGSSTNDSAATGNVGEYISSSYSSVSAGSTTAWADATNIVLTAGDWDVMHQSVCNQAAVASVTEVQIGISTTSGNSASGLSSGINVMTANGSFLGSGVISLTIARYRVSLSGSTTHYAKVFGAYSATAPQFNGIISARRVR